MTSSTASRSALLLLIGALAVLVPTAGCEPEPDVAPERHPWDDYALDAAVVDAGHVDDCVLPTATDLAEQLRDVAAEAEADVLVSASEPVVLSNDKLRWAVTMHFTGLWTLNLDGLGSTSLMRGMPPVVPVTTDDYREVWKDLRAAGVCGVSLIDWEFPAAKVQTVAWIIDATTFHESVTDSTIVFDKESLSGRRTDGRCGSARWGGSSLGTDLELGAPAAFLVQFGLCGDYIQPDQEEVLEGQDEVQPWDLVCGDAAPTIEGDVPFGRFTCGDVEVLNHPRCCGARVTCSLVIGLGGFEYSVSRTPTALACPERPWDEPTTDDCETEW